MKSNLSGVSSLQALSLSSEALSPRAQTPASLIKPMTSLKNKCFSLKPLARMIAEDGKAPNLA